MEDSDRGLLAACSRDCSMHLRIVAHEAGIVVRLARVERITPAFAKIEEGEVVPLQHQPPERKIGIAREAISVAQDDTRSDRVALTHDAYRCSVVHREMESCDGLGQDEPDRFKLNLNFGTRLTGRESGHRELQYELWVATIQRPMTMTFPDL